MSGMIRDEAGFLLASVLWGAGLTVVYDGLRILRRAIRHSAAMTAAEDLCYWIFAAFALFYLLFSMNDGTLRWYAIAGAASGMWLYHISLSPLLVRLLGGLLGLLLRWLGRLAVFLFRAAVRPAKSIGRFLKKRAVCLRIERNKRKRGEERGRKKTVAPSKQEDHIGDIRDSGHALRRFGIRNKGSAGKG